MHIYFFFNKDTIDTPNLDVPSTTKDRGKLAYAILIRKQNVLYNA